MEEATGEDSSSPVLCDLPWCRHTLLISLLCVCRSKCNFVIVHHHSLKMAHNRAETFGND